LKIPSEKATEMSDSEESDILSSSYFDSPANMLFFIILLKSEPAAFGVSVSSGIGPSSLGVALGIAPDIICLKPAEFKLARDVVIDFLGSGAGATKTGVCSS